MKQRINKIFGYIRASTGRQEHTHEAQRNTILLASKTCINQNPDVYEWGGFYEDKATSGRVKFLDRPGGIALQTKLEDGDLIIWSKLDRAFRNTSDFCVMADQWERQGVSFISCDLQLDSRSPIGKYVYTTLAALGELERSWIASRTRDAVATIKGLPKENQPPPGWRKLPGFEWEKDAAERKLINWIERQRDLGRSLKDINEHLRDNGIRRANGNTYTKLFIKTCLYAKLLNYPCVSDWQTNIIDKAEALINGANPPPREPIALRSQG